MKLLVTGATGLLGTELVAEARASANEVVALARADLDVTDAARVARAVAAHGPDLVVQCAAYTSVDGAEREPGLAMAVNRDGTTALVRAASAIDAKVVYVSTDYVFDGAHRRLYRPDDTPNPLSVYGQTKLAGERAALEAPGALVVRTSWLYGGARPSFLTSMLQRAARGESLKVVEDQTGGPSWSRSVARTILGLVERSAEGVWHAADRGVCTRVQLVREALRLAGLDAPVVPVAQAVFGGAARPSHTPLDVTATEALLGVRLPHWRESLASFLAERARTGGPGPPHPNGGVSGSRA